jgi:hypothetical protein
LNSLQRADFANIFGASQGGAWYEVSEKVQIDFDVPAVLRKLQDGEATYGPLVCASECTRGRAIIIVSMADRRGPTFANANAPR